MGTRSELICRKVETLRARCFALRRSLKAYTSERHASPATLIALQGIDVAVQALGEKLSTVLESEEAEVLGDGELELHIHNFSRSLPYLHKVLQLVQNSDVGSVPAELSGSIRREIRRIFPNAELIIVSVTDLNYSVVDIAAIMSNIWTSLECSPPENFPEMILRVAIPSVEFDQAMLHCIIAHEIGHPVYQRAKIDDSILNFKIDQEHLQNLYRELKKQAQPDQEDQDDQTQIDQNELQFRSLVTVRVNKILPSWIQELAADLYGLLLFGPAYVFACIYFSLCMSMLDHSSHTHPPIRLRLRLLLETLGTRYASDAESGPVVFSKRTSKLLEEWSSIAGYDIPLDVIGKVAMKTLDDNGVYERLKKLVENSLAHVNLYSKEQYLHDVRELTPLIDAFIPPAEYLKDGAPIPATTVGILNAAWEVWINGLTEFANNMRGLDDEFEVQLKFNQFVLKTLELNDIIHTWEAAKK